LVKDRYVAFKVPVEKMQEISASADKKGQTIAGWVRQMVYERLEQEKPQHAA
jgi:hypothetical protein